MRVVGIVFCGLVGFFFVLPTSFLFFCPLGGTLLYTPWIPIPVGLPLVLLF